MGDFSDNFLGIDNRLLGDGATDADTLPLDTLLENMLDSSTRWLVRRRHLVPRNFAGEPRRWASLFRLGIVYSPIYIAPNMDSVTVTIPATISSTLREEAGGGATVDIYARLRVLGLDGESATFWTGDGTLQTYSITLTFGEDTEAPSAGWAFLELSIRSVADGTIDSSKAIDGWSAYYVDPATGVSFDPGNWIATAFFSGEQFLGEVNYRQLPGAFGTPGANTGYPVTNLDGPDIGSAISVDIQGMSWIEPRGAFIEVAVHDDEPSEAYIPKAEESMRPNISVLGQHTMLHEQNIRGAYSRTELVAVGPQTIDPPQTTWGDKHKIWPTAYFADGATRLGEVTYLARRDAAKVDVYLWLQFAHIVSETLAIANAASRLDVARRDATRATWDVTVDLIQMSNGDDWTSATTVATETITLGDELHWLAAFKSPVMILRRLFFSYYSQGDGATAGKDHYLWNEGTLYVDNGDLTVCRPLLLTLDYAKTSAPDFDAPLLARVTVEASGVPSYQVDPDDRDTERIVCRCISMAVAERGIA